MNLLSKVSFALVGVFVAFAIGSYFSLSGTLIPAFTELERRAANQDLARARNGLAAYGRLLTHSSVDWGQWDETYAFVQDENPDFEAENLEAASLAALNLDFMAIFDRNNELYWGMFIDPSSDEGVPLDMANFDPDSVEKLLSLEEPAAEMLGLIMTEYGPSLVSSRPIVHSDVSGPVAGIFFIGRLLDDAQIAELSETAEVSIDLLPVAQTDRGSLLPDGESFLGQISQTIVDESRITRQVLHDVRGEPIVVLTSTSPREISGLQENTVGSIVALFAALGGILFIGLWFLLRTLIIGPVSKLRNKMIDIQNGGDLSDRLNLRRTDEIGDLASSFDNMLQELNDAKRRYIDQSFKAGMAEVAAGVLHNIRNSLMPIINNIIVARDITDNASNENIRRAVDELLTDKSPPERRQKLLQYLGMARERIDDGHAAVAKTLDEATDQLNRVVDILGEQEKFTHSKPVLEKVAIAQLVQEAAAVIPANEDPEVGVVTADIVSDCKVSAHRIGLLQVLNNILLNAYESIARTDSKKGKILIDAEVEEGSADAKIHIKISDSGSGIEASELEHIFDRGYTSKCNGRGGLGLHWSANALESMHGEISASSAGAGQGAEFRITLMAA